MCANSLAQGDIERFDIDRFAVEGNTLLPVEAVEDAVRPYVGKQRNYGDVQRALEALELAYRSRGYSAVQVHVPEQELGGAVRIQVVEVKLRNIKVLNAQFFSEANVRHSLPGLAAGGTPNATEISSNVQLANENPAKRVDVTLKVIGDEGLIDADVNVSDQKPRKAFVTLDNTGTSSTGVSRLGVGYQHANLLDRDHVASANFTTSPERPERVSIYSVSYRAPLYALGHSIDVIYAKSDVVAGATQTVAGPLNFAGRGDILGARYNHLLPRHGEYTHRLIYGFDYRAFDNTCSVGAFGASGCGAAGVDVTLRPANLTYSGALSRPGAVSDFYVTYSRNFPGGSHGGDADIAAARPSPSGGPGAPARYDLWRLGASTLRAMPRDWQVRGAVSAQYAHSPLVTAEQFGIAGASAVRGFLEREVARDSGWFANLELYSPDQAPALGWAASSLRGLLFYDFGAAANRALAGETDQKASIASLGIGARWSIEKSFSLRFDLARVMDEGGGRALGRYRGHLSVYASF